MVGAYAEQVVVGEPSVLHVPSGATFAAASTLLLNATTARLALDALALPRGATVAIVGSAGTVGGYAIQLAKADGLTVLAAAAQPDEDLVRSLGADLVVEPGDDFGAAIRRQVPSGAPALVDTASLDALALAAVADGGGLVTLKG